MNFALWVLIALGAVAALEGVLVRLHLLRQIEHASSDVPVDDATGLLNHRALDARLTGELKRLERMPGHTFWLSVWLTSHEDADAFGSASNDMLEFPDMGFRLDDTTYCFARIIEPGADPLDLEQRLVSMSKHWPTRYGVARAVDLTNLLPTDLVDDARSTATAAGEA